MTKVELLVEVSLSGSFQKTMTLNTFRLKSYFYILLCSLKFFFLVYFDPLTFLSFILASKVPFGQTFFQFKNYFKTKLK